MKIAYLIDQFFEHGGIEKILAQKINYWITHFGYEVVLITCRQQEKPFVYPLVEQVQHIDLNIQYDLSKSYFTRVNILKSQKHCSALKQIIKKIKPDVVISTSFTPDQYFLPYINKSIPKIKELHASGFTLTKNMGGLKKRLFQTLKKYDRLVVLNEREQAYFPDYPTAIITNFIEAAATEVADLDKKKNIILAAGRIAPVKQYDHLLKAWAIVAKDFPDWVLHLYGAGDATLKNKLQDLINTHQLTTQAYLMGGTQVLAEKMDEAKIFGMTSETECFPMVLLEAQRSGMVVLSYQSPHGPESIINHDIDGLLTKYNDFEEYARRLAGLIGDNQKMHYLAQNARRNVSRFSADVVMGAWNHLLMTLTQKDKK
ncbi:hypothetical protein DBR32_03730 [Taibaiella sp. KBW10]|nr:hypothetical protein DBR32_03730 [Taibaiella sp. KBW10]